VKKRRPSRAAVLARVRKICLSLPEAHEKVAWGAPTFRVRDRQFVMYVDNHHGDGRLALWCKAPPGAQEELVRADPDTFFVPPYVGKGGWIGIELDKGLDWGVVAGLVRDGYLEIAPPRLREELERK
jgi:predicted DNA-binding protein (MmcQ/YjbR family)